MATIVSANEINVNEISVVTFNSEAFAVEDESVKEYIANELMEAEDVEMLTSADDDFDTWASRLDFSKTQPKAIYVVDGNQMAFVMYSDNPYYN